MRTDWTGKHSWQSGAGWCLPDLSRVLGPRCPSPHSFLSTPWCNVLEKAGMSSACSSLHASYPPHPTTSLLGDFQVLLLRVQAS